MCVSCLTSRGPRSEAGSRVTRRASVCREQTRTPTRRTTADGPRRIVVRLMAQLVVLHPTASVQVDVTQAPQSTPKELSTWAAHIGDMELHIRVVQLLRCVHQPLGEDPASAGHRRPRPPAAGQPRPRRRCERRSLGRDPAGAGRRPRGPTFARVAFTGGSRGGGPGVATWARGDGRLAAIRQVTTPSPPTWPRLAGVAVFGAGTPGL